MVEILVMPQLLDLKSAIEIAAISDYLPQDKQSIALV